MITLPKLYTGDYYLGTSGTIELLDYDNNVYQNWIVNSDCSAEDGIIITAVEFNTEPNYDGVSISHSGGYQRCNRFSGCNVYTGDLEPFYHIVNSTAFTINFSSDSSATRSGFQFNWECNTAGVTPIPDFTGLLSTEDSYF